MVINNKGKKYVKNSTTNKNTTSDTLPSIIIFSKINPHQFNTRIHHLSCDISTVELWIQHPYCS